MKLNKLAEQKDNCSKTSYEEKESSAKVAKTGNDVEHGFEEAKSPGSGDRVQNSTDFCINNN